MQLKKKTLVGMKEKVEGKCKERVFGVCSDTVGGPTAAVESYSGPDGRIDVCESCRRHRVEAGWWTIVENAT
jgi:hypothetical protein